MESGEGIESLLDFLPQFALFLAPVESGEGIESHTGGRRRGFTFLTIVESGEGIERLLPWQGQGDFEGVESGEGIERCSRTSRCPPRL